MTQSKTIYGIQQYMTSEGMPEARGSMLELKTYSIPGILDAWDFQYFVIHMPRKLFVAFPTKEAAERHLKENASEVGPSYLKNFKFDEEA